MPPDLAVAIFAGAIFWFLWNDVRYGIKLSGPLWIALFWMLILGSRPLSYWFNSGSGDVMEGNALDRNMYLLLAFACIVILNRRGINWNALLSDNAAVFLFYGYLLMTCIWSEVPFVTFKRWFKDISVILLALTILSSPKVKEVLVALFTRGASILFLVSVLFIKYIPELGRSYSRSGGMQITGVTDQKNTLGEVVIVYGLVLAWGILESGDRFRKYLPKLLLIVVGVWLIQVSDSKTSAVCATLGLVVLFSDRIPGFRANRKRFVVFCVCLIPALYVLNETSNLKAELLSFLGRNETLTGRTEIWKVVGENPADPLIGAGYLRYWEELGEFFIDGYPVTLKTAHNGYLDIYLDGGWLGELALILMLFSLGTKIVREFIGGSSLGKLRFAVLIIVVVHNFSESTFARRGTLWLAFLLFCLDYSRACRIPRSDFESSSQPFDLDQKAKAIGHPLAA